ncbi:hypothetical protein MJO28_014395, partial [Puccinia striiformis f. sp. tritici]
SSGNTLPRPRILDQSANLDLIFSTLIINDLPIHQQRPVDLNPIPKIDHLIERLSRIQSTLMPLTTI